MPNYTVKQIHLDVNLGNAEVGDYFIGQKSTNDNVTGTLTFSPKVEMDPAPKLAASLDLNGKNLTGNLRVQNYNSGTNASSSTYLRGDGTWINPSVTFGTVSAGLINQVAYYASAGNTVSGLTTANNGVLITGGTGIPSISTTLPSGLAIPTPTLSTPALGTPSSGVLTSCTGLPVSTGISGFGTNVSTALAVNVGSAGSPVINGGVLGTPSSGTLTNCTSIPVANATGTLLVANGGSGRASTTAYAPIVGGTTSTGANQSMASGSTGQIMQSAGNAAVPTWSTPTYPSTSGTARKILVSDGTNNVYSTETHAVPGSAGNLMRSDGTNWTAAKATLTTDVTGTLPATNGGTGLATATTGDILYASATNTFSKLGIGNDGQRLSIASGIPAWKGGKTAFRAYRSTNQSITANTPTKVQYDTEDFDTGNYFDNATNYRYTPLIAGKYYISSLATFSNTFTAGTLCVIYIYKNGAAIAENFAYSSLANQFVGMFVGGLTDMNGTTDYLEIYVSQADVASRNLLGGTITNYVSGVLLEAT